MMVHVGNPSYLRGRGRRIKVQGQPRQNHNTLSQKQTRARKTEGVAQVEECSISKQETPSSSPGN
jgi:hypothetical protein